MGKENIHQVIFIISSFGVRSTDGIEINENSAFLQLLFRAKYGKKKKKA